MLPLQQTAGYDQTLVRETAREVAARDRALILVVVLAVLLNGAGLGWGLPLRGFHAWDVDGIAPLDPLVAAKRMIVDDWWNSGYYNKYPLGHFFILMAAYAPYVGYLWLTGDLRHPTEVYPFGFSDPETALTVLALIARVMALLMGVGIVVLVYLTVRRLAGRVAAVFSALTVACSPAFIFYAHTGNVDTPSLFWSAFGLFAFGRLLSGHCERRDYVLLGAVVGMAIATKEQTIGLFLFMPLSAVIVHAQNRRAVPRSIRQAVRIALDPPLLAGLAASLVTFVVATHLIFNWHGNMLRLQWRLYGIHPTYGTNYPGSHPEIVGTLDALGQITWLTCDIVNPVLFLAGVVGLVVLPFRHRWARHFVVPLASYVWLISPGPFFRARFVMEAALVLAFFTGPILGPLWALAVARSRALAAGLALVGLYSIVYGAETDYLLVRDARYDAEAWLETNAPAGSTIEVFSGPAYLPRLPRHATVRYQRDLASAWLERLPERSPDFLVLSSGYSRRFERKTTDAALLERLLAGDFGYRPIRTFRRGPWISPDLFAWLSPEIVVLAPGR
jgi:4-amino-4-deoxy-L-arabinose transferase-like glycosyltransferase